MQLIKGFSLIELVVLIVVMGIASAAVLLPLQTTLQKSPTDNQITLAVPIAQLRMETILNQRRTVGYSSFTDICGGGSPPAVCTLPAALSAYTFTPTPTIVGTTISGDSSYKTITVTVSGPNNVQAQVKTLVGDY